MDAIDLGYSRSKSSGNLLELPESVLEFAKAVNEQESEYLTELSKRHLENL